MQPPPDLMSPASRAAFHDAACELASVRMRSIYLLSVCARVCVWNEVLCAGLGRVLWVGGLVGVGWSGGAMAMGGEENRRDGGRWVA